MHRDAHHPAERVPAPGVYWVHHYQHRLTHAAWISSATFPACARCGDKVRFRRAEVGASGEPPAIDTDADFRESGSHSQNESAEKEQ